MESKVAASHRPPQRRPQYLAHSTGDAINVVLAAASVANQIRGVALRSLTLIAPLVAGQAQNSLHHAMQTLAPGVARWGHFLITADWNSRTSLSVIRSSGRRTISTPRNGFPS